MFNVYACMYVMVFVLSLYFSLPISAITFTLSLLVCLLSVVLPSCNTERDTEPKTETDRQNKRSMSSTVSVCVFLLLSFSVFFPQIIVMFFPLSLKCVQFLGFIIIVATYCSCFYGIFICSLAVCHLINVFFWQQYSLFFILAYLPREMENSFT